MHPLEVLFPTVCFAILSHLKCFWDECSQALGLAEEEHRRWQEQGIEDDFSGAFRQPQRPPPRRATPLVFESDYTEGGGAAPSSSSRSEDLQRALEQKNLEMLQLAQELEEVKAEKVSLEYLLRERLEKMVQTEIEDRIQAYRQEVEEWRASGQRDTPPVPSLSGLENKSASRCVLGCPLRAFCVSFSWILHICAEFPPHVPSPLFVPRHPCLQHPGE